MNRSFHEKKKSKTFYNPANFLPTSPSSSLAQKVVKRASSKQKKAISDLFELHRNTLLELDKHRQLIRNEALRIEETRQRNKQIRAQKRSFEM